MHGDCQRVCEFETQIMARKSLNIICVSSLYVGNRKLNDLNKPTYQCTKNTSISPQIYPFNLTVMLNGVRIPLGHGYR